MGSSVTLRLIMKAAMFLVVAAVCSGAEKPYDPKADPEADFSAARAEAARKDKRILVKVGGEWCGWCHRMDKFIADNKPISDLLEAGFVVVKVNFSEENKNQKFLGKLPAIDGYPHLFVFDADGRLLQSQETGSLEEGKGYSRERFQEFLAKWSPRR